MPAYTSFESDHEVAGWAQVDLSEISIPPDLLGWSVEPGLRHERDCLHASVQAAILHEFRTGDFEWREPVDLHPDETRDVACLMSLWGYRELPRPPVEAVARAAIMGVLHWLDQGYEDLERIRVTHDASRANPIGRAGLHLAEAVLEGTVPPIEEELYLRDVTFALDACGQPDLSVIRASVKDEHGER